MMIELSKHIEILLLSNDCVVVPELGGFIAHYQSAYYEEAEALFLPPSRTVGFNPQLTMNDGLLVQSYMQTYHTDFSDATRRIAETVEDLKEKLYQGETVELHGVGALHYNIYNEYEFQPHESGLLAPSLYGLDSFNMTALPKEYPMESVQPVEQKVVSPLLPKKEIRLNPHWLSNTVAVAVAILLFFILSVPVENTYIDKGSYASLGTDCLLDAIRSQSMATTFSAEEQPQQQAKREVKPVVVKVEKVAPAKTEELSIPKKPIVKAVPAEAKKENVAPISTPTPKKNPVAKKETASKNKYHIIVSSLTTSADAQRVLKEFKQKGYNGASVVEGNGRFRIALYSFADKTEANQKLSSLKQQESFKSAWLLSSK